MRAVQKRKTGVAAPSDLPKEARKALAQTEALARLVRDEAVVMTHHPHLPHQLHLPHLPHLPHHLPHAAGAAAPLTAATGSLEVMGGAQTSADGQACSMPGIALMVVTSTNQESEGLRRGNNSRAISRARAAAAARGGTPDRRARTGASSSSSELHEVDSLPRDLYAGRMCAANSAYLSRITAGPPGTSPGRVALRGPRRSHGDGSPLQRQKSSAPRSKLTLGNDMLDEVVWKSSVHQPSAGKTHPHPYPAPAPP